jgi:hypothetical protein
MKIFILSYNIHLILLNKQSPFSHWLPPKMPPRFSLNTWLNIPGVNATLGALSLAPYNLHVQMLSCGMCLLDDLVYFCRLFLLSLVR